MKKNNYKITVIIPCYNQGKYIEEAVGSVLNQTYQNFEIIIINDGSTDKYTNKILKNYCKPKTKVYFTKNQGLASTRNYGFKLSKGEIIQFLDADDFLAPTKFEEQIKEFEKDSLLGVSFTNYKYYYEHSRQFSEPQMQDVLGKVPFHDFVYKWQRGLSIPIHCGLFRKSIWEGTPPFVERFKAIEDWIMWVTIARKKCKFKYLDKSYAFYRIQPKNMTKDKTFMLYWVARAISYIAENLIEPDELEKFNTEQAKYLKELTNIFYLAEYDSQIAEKFEEQGKEHAILENQLKAEINLQKEEKLEIEKRLEFIIKSRAYRLGNALAWLPRKIRQIFKQ